jgi:hypothetical protein
LKPASRAAGAQIVATELLHKLLVAVHYAEAALHASFRRITLPPLAGALKSSGVHREIRGFLPYRPPGDSPLGLAGGGKVLRGGLTRNRRPHTRRGPMHEPIRILLTMALLLLSRPVGAQTALDTLPERVVAHIYDAINHCDRKGWYSWFAPVWYHSDMEDSSAAVTRRTSEELGRKAEPGTWFASCGDTPRADANGPLAAARKLVVGPFVVVQEAVMDWRHVILDIYEVRGGKVVHQWESGDYARWVPNAQSD